MILLSLVVAGASQEVQADSMDQSTLRILTFNIKHGATMRGDFDLDRIAGVIRDSGADLVALQEVDIKTGRARGLDLAAELAQRTGMVSAFGKAMDYDGGAYGNAVLSRYPIEEERCEALPAPGGHEPRAALAVQVTVPGHGTLRFISTHLEVAAEEDRLAQAKFLNQHFTQDDTVAILAGDFNTEPGSITMAEFQASWATAGGDNPKPTYPSKNPEIKIDYVMYRPAARYNLVESRVIEDDIASDHCAYLAVLDLPAK